MYAMYVNSSNEITFNRNILNASVRIKGLSERKNSLINFKLRQSIIISIIVSVHTVVGPSPKRLSSFG